MEITELGKKLLGNDIEVYKSKSGWEVSIISMESYRNGRNANFSDKYRIGQNPLEVKALIDMGIINLIEKE